MALKPLLSVFDPVLYDPNTGTYEVVGPLDPVGSALLARLFGTGVVADGTIQAAALGVKTDGSDNAVLMQSILDNAPDNSTIVLPAGTVNISKPLSTYKQIRVVGQGKYSTTVAGNTNSPTWMHTYNSCDGAAGNIPNSYCFGLTPPALAGKAGKSLKFYNAPGTGSGVTYLNYADRKVYVNGFTGFQCAFFIKIGNITNGGNIVWSGQGPLNNNPFPSENAVQVAYGSDGHIEFVISTSTGQTVLNSSAGLLTAGTWYFVECSYDGVNMRIFTGPLAGTATMKSKVAKTGTIRASTEADFLIGPASDSWPMGNNIVSGSWDGEVYALTCTNTAWHSTDANYTVPTDPSQIPNSYQGGQLLFDQMTGNNNFTHVIDTWMPIYTKGGSFVSGPTFENLSMGGDGAGSLVLQLCPGWRLRTVGLGGGRYGLLAHVNCYEGIADDLSVLNCSVASVNMFGQAGLCEFRDMRSRSRRGIMLMGSGSAKLDMPYFTDSDDGYVYADCSDLFSQIQVNGGGFSGEAHNNTGPLAIIRQCGTLFNGSGFQGSTLITGTPLVKCYAATGPSKITFNSCKHFVGVNDGAFIDYDVVPTGNIPQFLNPDIGGGNPATAPWMSVAGTPYAVTVGLTTTHP